MTEHDERKSDNKGVDFLGLFLSGVGGLFFVSILLSFGDRQPKDMLWTAPVVGLIDALGRVPGLLLSGGVAALGTALFLGLRLALARTLLGLCGVAVGLALLVGAVVPGHGGLLGTLPLELLGATAGRLVGALLGLVVLAVSAIGAWFSGSAEGAAASAGGVASALVPTLRSRQGGEGVSAAEAHALAPSPPAAPRRAPVPEPRASVTPSSPYPPDARLEGKLPPGTRPLDGSRAFVPQPPRRSDPLADEAPLVKAFGEPRPVEGGERVEARASGATAVPLEEATGGPVIPSWERARHVRVEPADPWEEPRTAAPESVESHVPEEAPVAEADQEPAADAVPAGPEADPGTEVAPRAGSRSATRAKATGVAADEAAPKVEKAKAKGAKPRGGASRVAGTPPAAWEQVGLFDADEPEAAEPEESSEPEPEEAPVALAEAQVDEDEVDEEYEEEEDEDELLAQDEDDEGGDEDDEDHEDEEETYDEAEAEEDEDEDEEEEDEDLAASAEEPDAAADEEPERVIRAAAPPKPAVATSKKDLEELIHEAGCLVIEQNRVAVSMLQRSFQIDFDQACLILDQLQERGLIGPYMGGRTRDILLTREEWLAQAPTA